MPTLPLKTVNGNLIIEPCRASHAPQIEHHEYVNMYPVWPFLMFPPANLTSSDEHYCAHAVGVASLKAGAMAADAIPGEHNSHPGLEAAALGLANLSAELLTWTSRARPVSQADGGTATNVPRFPGFWGSFSGNCSNNPLGNPYTTDCTFGDSDPYPATAAKHRNALQLMLLQAAAPVNPHTAEGRRIVIFPGWPVSWGE